MVVADLLRREHQQSDRRSSQLLVTEEAFSLVDELLAIVVKAHADFLEVLSSAESEELTRLLAKLWSSHSQVVLEE